MFESLHNDLANMIKVHTSTDMVQLQGKNGKLHITMATPKIGLVSTTFMKVPIEFNEISVDAKALLIALKGSKKPPAMNGDIIQFGRFKLAVKDLPPIRLPKYDPEKFTIWPDHLSKSFIELFNVTNCGNSPPSVFGWQAYQKNNRFYAGSTNGSIARLYSRKSEGEDVPLVTIPPSALGTVGKLIAGKENLKIISSPALSILKSEDATHYIATPDDDTNISIRDVIQLTREENTIEIENSPFKGVYERLRPFFLSDSETRWTLKDGKLSVAIESSVGATTSTVSSNAPSDESLTFTVHVKQLAALVKVANPTLILVKKGGKIARMIYREKNLRIILPCTT